MTKMEIIALRGVAQHLEAEKKAPRPDWMSEDLYRGRVDAYTSAEMVVRELLAAAEEG